MPARNCSTSTANSSTGCAALTAAAERLSQSGLARRLGTSRQAVHDLVRRGIIAVDDEGLIDVAEATEAMAKTLRADAKSVAAIMASEPEPTQAEPPAIEPPAGPEFDPTAATSYHVARTLREAAEAQIAQLKLRVMAGALLDSERVKTAATTLAAMTRNAFEKIPDKLADRLAAEADATACHAMLVAEIDQVLADLAARARSEFTEVNYGRL